MKRIPTLFLKFIGYHILVLVLSTNIQAQDTITVQTLTLDSPTRSGSFTFPDDPTQTYRKILMKYTMRCLDGALNPGDNSTGCHEWDYSCNTFLTDSTTIDSIRASHPSHIISNFSGTTFNYTNQPTYTHYQYNQQEVTYDNVITENSYDIGNGTMNLNHPFSTTASAAKAQYLWTAAELTTAGISAGDISSIRMDVNNIGTNVDFLRIKLKSTFQTTLNPSSVEDVGFTEVYFLNTTPSMGENSYNFHTPFNWDGSSNILVEFTYNNTTNGTNTTVKGDDTGSNSGLYSNAPDRYMEFSGAEYISAPTDAFASLSNEISISFWANGNTDVMPANSYAFEGLGPDGERQANVHLPWSNGRVYWDCGNDGSGYDRIDKAAATADYEGQWNHWTFTKNASTGSMKIYLNGALWHSGTGATKPIDVSTFNIAASGNLNGRYYGGLNEFTVWDKELSQATIQDWMYKDIDASHPNYSNLIAYYQLDEETGQSAMDSSPNAAVGTISGAPLRKIVKGEDIFRNFNSTTMRPQVSFVQGTYNQSIQNIIVTESELNGQSSITEYSVVGTDLVEGTTNNVWEAGFEYTYDEDGNEVGSQAITPEGIVNITDLTYYRKVPSKYELISFVTPYGFNVDLGPEGQTWTFDVTDFAPVLKGNRFLSMERGGQYNEEFDIKFLFITGTPPRDVKSIQNIWPFGSGSYNAITANDIFEPRDVAFSADGSEFKLRSSVTGHQQNGEFMARTHFINVDGGSNDFSFQVWKECGENPIYPQGGTWIFDRAGWCPGMPTDLEEMDLTPLVTPGGVAEIDYGVIPSADQSATNYLVSNQMVTYGAANFATDAEVVTVIRPSDNIEYGRMNPICNNPIVVIQNTGSNVLTSLDITYGTEGGETETYAWTGNLDFMETEEVTLPTSNYSFWQTATSNKFDVTISQPNGQADENADNDSFQSTFNMTDKHEGTLTFNYRTNKRAFQNSFRLKDQDGNVVLERANMTNETTYNDDITLMPGCYSMEFNDTGDDGLDFWFWEVVEEDVGTGYFRIRQNGTILKTFNPDYGAFIKYDFFVNGTVSNEDLEQNTVIGVYPNPTQGNFIVEMNGFEGKDMGIEVVDVMGRVLYQRQLNISYQEMSHEIDITNFADGVYFVKIHNEEKTTVKQVVKQGGK